MPAAGQCAAETRNIDMRTGEAPAKPKMATFAPSGLCPPSLDTRRPCPVASSARRKARLAVSALPARYCPFGFVARETRSALSSHVTHVVFPRSFAPSRRRARAAVRGPWRAASSASNGLHAAAGRARPSALIAHPGIDGHSARSAAQPSRRKCASTSRFASACGGRFHGHACAASDVRPVQGALGDGGPECL